MKKLLLLLFITLFITLLSGIQSHVFARGVEQKPAQFISSIFNDSIPKAQVLWLSKADKIIVADILQHKFKLLRIRYWQKITKKNNESVWILNEIGKEKPITIGVNIKNQQIVQLKVLAYRESRGDEVRHSFFTKQFDSAKLTKKNKLDRHIDGITGATLSVRALTKVARLALWLDQKINTQ
ncbi:MAG: FMN-binding protein [Gammaproteobacteria bacterium]|nr:MAG: FMN-binding protein [Gammaproteobacteria bacterium]